MFKRIPSYWGWDDDFYPFFGAKKVIFQGEIGGLPSQEGFIGDNFAFSDSIKF